MGLSRTQRLLGMTTLSTCLCLTELAVGVRSGSLALVVDSVHLGSDVLTLLLSAAATAAAAASTGVDDAATAVDGSIDNDADGCRAHRPRGSWWWRRLVGPNTWGAARAEVLAAFANAVFLIAVALNMAAEAVERLATAEPVARPRLALAAALGGMVVNAAGMVLFTDWTEEDGEGAEGGALIAAAAAKGDDIELHPLCDDASDESTTDDGRSSSDSGSDSPTVRRGGRSPPILPTTESTVVAAAAPSGSSLNMKAVFLHVAGDFAGAALISASCTTLWLRPSFRYGWALDPAASLGLVTILLASAVPLAVRSGRVLLCGVPSWGGRGNVVARGHDDSDDDATGTGGAAGIAATLRRLPGVSPTAGAVHDLRLWQLSDSVGVASVHLVVVPPRPPSSSVRAAAAAARSPVAVRAAACRVLRDAGYADITVQVEVAGSDACASRRQGGRGGCLDDVDAACGV
ncbi:hypothetical protein MMPV_000950 [Pyropia vietnamensis]